MSASEATEARRRPSLAVYGPLIVLLAVVIGGWAATNVFDSVLRTDDNGLYPGEIDADLLDDYGDVFGVAHNAGNRVSNAELALANDADIIEIDVVSSSTTLYASHEPPPRLGSDPRSATRLTSAWYVANENQWVMLDLKQSSRSFLVRVAAFLHVRPSADTIVVSRSPAALRFLAEEVPHATLFLSAPSRASLDRVLEDEKLAATVDGVSAVYTLLDEETLTALDERGLPAFAWVVNDVPSVNELVANGVRGIITDNLSILRLLGNGDSDEPEPLRPPPLEEDIVVEE